MPRPRNLPTNSHRLHYIPEWAERHNLTQADIARDLEVDKSSVSRWFAGGVPTEKWLVPLALLFGVDEVAALFRPPDDDWFVSFLRDRSDEERARIKAILELVFLTDSNHEP
jgi:transcriptional regulator with XRE-family HTH domain